jgi:alpha-tubulin suppressor-like RCC1 family protein
VTFPFSFGAVKSKADAFLLVVVGFEGERAVIEQKARVGFDDGQKRLLTIRLAQACYEKLCAERDTSAWFQSTCDGDLGMCSGVTTPDTVIAGGDEDAGALGEDGGMTRGVDAGASDAQTSSTSDSGGMDASASNGTDAGSLDASSNGTDAGNSTLDSGNNPQQEAGSGPIDGGAKDTGALIDAQPVSCGTLTCPATANCVSAPSPHCECKPGYQGSGTTCTNINDCTATSCAAPSSCVDGVMDFSCTCAANYIQLTTKTCGAGFVALTAGGDNCFARRVDGTVTAWGRNVYGEFGNGTTIDSNKPLTIAELNGFVEIRSSEYFMCGLRSNGTVACAGFNSSGELGNGMTASSPGLVNVAGINDAVELALGYEHACARRSNGSVSCWGANGRGQLGNPSVTADVSATPVAVTNLSNATEIAAGGYHNCARRMDGSIVCWGSNISGQLGDPALADQSSAALVQVVPGGQTGSPVLVNPVGLALGEWHSCARLMSNAAVCWGYGGHGELGDGLNRDSAAPVRVTGLQTGVAEIRVNRFYSCARKSDGTVSCWGAWPGMDVGTPVAITGVTGAVEVAAAQFHTCARKSDGQVLCWGQNNYGQFGSGMTAPDANPPTAFTTPVQVKQY